MEWFCSKLFNDDFEDLGKSMTGEVLIEEYLAGRELSVEGYVSNGKINFVSVTDKFLGPEPNFVEIGHIVAANTITDVKKNLLNYASSVISALNISLGPFHCEIRLTEEGPVLIEIAARLPGDNISELIELVTGVSLAKKMVKGYLGTPIQDHIQSSPIQYAGVRFIYADTLAGSFFSHLEGVEMLSKMPGFQRFKALMQSGTHIPPVTDYRARIAEVIFTGATYQEVKNRLALANNLVQVKVLSHG